MTALDRLWMEIGLVQRYSNETLESIMRMTLKDFRRLLLVHLFWERRIGGREGRDG